MSTVAAHPIVYLNRQFMPIEQATISVTDRGFLFADSVYEVIPVYNGHLFCADQHLTRLANSLNAIGLLPPLTQSEWQHILTHLINQNGGGNQSVYLQITRGPTPGRLHTIPDHPQATVFAMCTPLPPNTIATLRQGIRTITLPDCRWTRCYIKSTALLPNVLLGQQAKLADANDAILLRDGVVTEGTASNVFIVKNNAIYTPAKTDTILGGITRDVIIDLAHQHEIPIHETTVDENQLRTADEIWLTSSTREIRPVIVLDDQAVGNGIAGPLWERLITLYQTHYQTLTQPCLKTP